MKTSVFLCHNSNDKPFVRKLAFDLEAQGIRYWLDEAEIRVGQSLIREISKAIDSVDFLVVVLSPNSVQSAWVLEEVELAMNQQIDGKRLKVLPLLHRKCDLPGFLRGKLYADFTDEAHYVSHLEKLVKSMGLVFSSSAHERRKPGSNLSRAASKAITEGLRILSKPFHRPQQYVGMRVSDAAIAVRGTPNKINNIVVEDDECRLFLEAEGNYVCFVEAYLKRTEPHSIEESFDPEAILGSFSISLAELEHHSSTTACHRFSDHAQNYR